MLLQIHHMDKFDSVPYGLFLGPKVSTVIQLKTWNCFDMTMCRCVLNSSVGIFMLTGAGGGGRDGGAGEGDPEEDQEERNLGRDAVSEPAWAFSYLRYTLISLLFFYMIADRSFRFRCLLYVCM